MGKVLRANPASGTATLQYFLPSPLTEAWVTFDVLFSPETIALFDVHGDDFILLVQDHSSDNAALLLTGAAGGLGVSGDPGAVWADGTNGGSCDAPTPDTAWHTIEFHYEQDVVSELYIDGTLQWSVTPSGSHNLSSFALGPWDTSGEDAPFYFDNVKIGTTRGGSDIISDDFESGDLSPSWSATGGDQTIVADPASLTYAVTYFGHGADGGSPPTDSNAYAYGATGTVLGHGSMTRTGYTFTGWNTRKDGSGTAYSPGDLFTITSAVKFYAQWSDDGGSPPYYDVTYDGNGSDGGTVPVDGTAPYRDGVTVTVIGPGDLSLTGYTFLGWNTSADGTGTSYLPADTFTIAGADVTLYAEWLVNDGGGGGDGGGGDDGHDSSPDGHFIVGWDNGPLDSPVTWSAPDALDGVTLLNFTWDRGRPSDVDKVVAGTATAYLLDTSGQLDPTNDGNSLWDAGKGRTKINPRKPARLRIKNAVSGGYNVVFTGFIQNIKYQVGETGEYAFVTITLTDDLDLLTRAEVIPGVSSGGGTATASGNAVYLAQTVDDRLIAALADAAQSCGGPIWPPGRIRVASGNVDVQKKSYAAKTSILTVIDDAVDAEIPGVANRYCRRDGTFRFRGRYERFRWRYYADLSGSDLNVWKVSDSAGDPSTHIILQNGQESGDGPFAFDRSDDNLANAGLSYPAGIHSADIPGQLTTDADSINEFGLCVISFEDLAVNNGNESRPGPNLNANDETKQYGAYYVANRKLPQNRPETLVFGSEAPDGDFALSWSMLGKIELSDVIKLTTHHPGGGGFNNEAFFVEHITGSCKPGPVDLVSVKVDVSPASHFTDDIFAT